TTHQGPGCPAAGRHRGPRNRVDAGPHLDRHPHPRTPTEEPGRRIAALPRLRDHPPRRAVVLMADKTSRQHRNQRNNPYLIEDLAVRLHRSAAGVAWRWRTELATLITGATATAALAHIMTLMWAGVVLGTAAAGLLAIPHSRRFVTRRCWCVLARHRIQK